jgi:methyltransferase (TIGR00027 family)
MDSRVPSRTAFAVARHRAGHQVLEGGRIFSDPYACAILGESPETIAAQLTHEPDAVRIRLYMAARSRIGEDWLHAAHARGVRQAAVLGAGFDTFALRNPYPNLKIFEVDHPASQGWKRERLAAAGLALPKTLTFVPVDFEKEDLAEALAQSGFDTNAPAFFLWLGVVPYLEKAAIFQTLSVIARVPGSEVAFDYSEPLENYPPHTRPTIEAMSKRVAAVGEPWLTHFDPDALATRLRRLGFTEIEDLDRNAVVCRLSGVPNSQPREVGPHLLRARC